MPTNPAARDSRCETRMAAQSPFRSHDDEERAQAAAEMLLKRGQELVVLEARLAKATTATHRNALRTRIAATRRNMQSWLDYLQDEAPRERRAVMHPQSA